jgi:hypothetical protein
MKAYWGSGGIVPCIFVLEIDGCERLDSRHGSFTPWEKNPRYPLGRRLGGSQSLSERGGEEKNSQPLLGLKPLITWHEK